MGWRTSSPKGVEPWFTAVYGTIALYNQARMEIWVTQHSGESDHGQSTRTHKAPLLGHRAAARPAPEHHFADRGDVMLGGGGYLVFDAGDVGEFYPDCVFADGVSDPPAGRRG